jgi:Cu(I)/Ag(I) efflux system membrane protein CusA/SilA
MIQAIIRFSARNRVLVLLATSVAVGYGLYTVRHIPVDAIPDLSTPGHRLLPLDQARTS